MFSGLGISLLINPCFPCCAADGNSRERNAKQQLGKDRRKGERRERALRKEQRGDRGFKYSPEWWGWHWQQPVRSHAVWIIGVWHSSDDDRNLWMQANSFIWLESCQFGVTGGAHSITCSAECQPAATQQEEKIRLELCLRVCVCVSEFEDEAIDLTAWGQNRTLSLLCSWTTTSWARDEL